MTGQTTIIASRAATSLLVSLPRPVVLGGTGCLNVPEVTYSGSADVVMLVMMRQPYDPRDTTSNQVFGAGKFPRSVDGLRVDTACGPNRTLDAGTYRLVIQHTMGTLVLRLRFPGLPGRSVLRATAPSRAHLNLLPKIAPSDQTQPVQQEYGTYDTLADRGLVLDFGYVNTPVTAVVNFSDCTIPPGQPALPDLVAFSAACPTGVRGSFLLTGPVTSAYTFFAAGYYNIPAGRWGDGFAYDNAGVTSAATAFAAWVPFSG